MTIHAGLERDKIRRNLGGSYRNSMTIQSLLTRGVIIPAPEAVVCEDILVERIMPGVVLYPGTVLCGRETYIGRNTQIGAGGGAWIENSQIGADAVLMQGAYRDSTLFNGVHIRNGAELRDNCLLEEGADLGHTVGLKQTILFPDVVLGSLINFCDVLMSGGTGRKNHSEVGSCMALYNYTPNGDKFASRFGDVPRGLFLHQPPVFIGGQTQIVSPVRIGFGTVVAAGSKLSGDVPDGRIIAQNARSLDAEFDAACLYAPDKKIIATLDYIANIQILRHWYLNVRKPVSTLTHSEVLIDAALKRLEAVIRERKKRLTAYARKIPTSLGMHRSANRKAQIDAHLRAQKILDFDHETDFVFDFSKIVQLLCNNIKNGLSYPEAVRNLPQNISIQASLIFEKWIEAQIPHCD